MISSSLISTPLPQISSSHKFKRRDVIPLESNILWHIDRGFVRTLTWDLTGTVVTLGFWGPGDIIGYSLSQTEPYQIECLSALEAHVLAANYGYSHEAMMAHIQQAEALLKIVRGGRADSRLLQFLSWLSQRFGCASSQGQLLKLRLTHQDIADVLGTTRVTVTKLLKQLEQEGRIGWSNRQECILIGNHQAITKQIEHL
ncbi:MAG: Crp/Fnr family transcriptional regulator [Cyanothece sp. SIO1E1]|nr:Crp/Fnr family transcriptional regulator [Cyanothece sp. SIO1E1]